MPDPAPAIDFLHLIYVELQDRSLEKAGGAECASKGGYLFGRRFLEDGLVNERVQKSAAEVCKRGMER